jgi:hypothetical protein
MLAGAQRGETKHGKVKQAGKRFLATLGMTGNVFFATA